MITCFYDLTNILFYYLIQTLISYLNMDMWRRKTLPMVIILATMAITPRTDAQANQRTTTATVNTMILKGQLCNR